jgi:hypothetical protein
VTGSSYGANGNYYAYNSWTYRGTNAYELDYNDVNYGGQWQLYAYGIYGVPMIDYTITNKPSSGVGTNMAGVYATGATGLDPGFSWGIMDTCTVTKGVGTFTWTTIDNAHPSTVLLMDNLGNFYGALPPEIMARALAAYGGITTNLQFKMSGFSTNTLCFTNGVLMRVTQP